MAVKERVKAWLPDALVRKLQRAKKRREIRSEFRRDERRFLKSIALSEAGSGDQLTDLQVEAQVTKDYHRIEKGLALRSPRRPFGAAPQARLAKSSADLAPDALHREHAATALQALERWNTNGTVDDNISPPRGLSDARGISDPDLYFRSRRSVRDFDDRPVDLSQLERAAELAINSPSVCNRQSWKVRYYLDEEAREVLKYQNGNSGFRDTIPAVALVTADLQLSTGSGERNQAWIEGGLFSMSLVWALHALGLDSCMLNMSVSNAHADRLRASEGISDSEVIIMMIAIGHGRKGHRVARSPRRPTSAVVEWARSLESSRRELPSDR